MKGLIIVLGISLFLVASAPFVLAGDNSVEHPSKCEVLGEVLWIRPIGFIQTGLGAIAYVISLPVTVPLKKNEEAKEFLILFPYNNYFKRPLGEM